RQVLADLDGALGALAREPRLPVLVVRSGKKSGFLAGADLHEFTAIKDAAAARALSAAGQKLFDKLASLPAPSVAVIHGPCIAGGKRPRRRLPLRGWRQRLLESNPFGRRLILKGTERLLRRRVPDDMPAPHEALEAVRIGLERGQADGLRREQEAAARLALSP